MAATKRRSKKQSAASSAQQPEKALTYFVDECLGRHFVADALRAVGVRVEIHHEHFPAGAPDTEWLPAVGRQDWIVLTKDRQIRRRELEIAALLASGVRAFVLTAADLTGSEQGAAFVRALPKMERIVRSSRGSLIGRVSASGAISLLRLPHPRSKKG